MKYALIKHSDTTSDKQIYGDRVGQAPGDGLGQANLCNMHLYNTLIRSRTWTRTSKYTDMDPDMDSDQQIDGIMHLLTTLIRPRTWTRTCKYTDMDSDKNPDMDSDK